MLSCLLKFLLVGSLSVLTRGITVKKFQIMKAYWIISILFCYNSIASFAFPFRSDHVIHCYTAYNL